MNHFSRKALVLGCLVGVFGLNASALDSFMEVDSNEAPANGVMLDAVLQGAAKVAGDPTSAIDSVLDTITEVGGGVLRGVANGTSQAATAVKEYVQGSLADARAPELNAEKQEEPVDSQVTPILDLEKQADLPMDQALVTSKEDIQTPELNAKKQEELVDSQAQPILDLKKQADLPMDQALVTSKEDSLDGVVQSLKSNSNDEEQKMFASFLAWIQNHPGTIIAGLTITAASVYGLYELWKAEFAQKYKKLAVEHKKKVACVAAVSAVAAGLLLNNYCIGASVLAMSATALPTTSAISNK